MHSIESAVITYTIIITCFTQVSSLTLARGQALTAGATRGLAERLQVRQSDTTEATRWIKASLSSDTDSHQSTGPKGRSHKGAHGETAGEAE